MSFHQETNPNGSESRTIEEDQSLPPFYVTCPNCGSYIGDAYCKNPNCDPEAFLESGNAHKRLKDFCKMLNSALRTEPADSSRNPPVGYEAGPADSSSNPPVGYEGGPADSSSNPLVGCEAGPADSSSNPPVGCEA